MKTEAGCSSWWALALVLAGVLALVFGPKALLAMAIAATVLWFGILEPSSGRSQN